MSDAQICRLEAIELEEDDLDLFPDHVVEAYKKGPQGPRRAYGMMKNHARVETNVARKARQKFWLSQRRIWSTEGSNPSQFTFNGIGTRMYGRRDRNLEDGSYLTTLYIVFLYFPILPLSSHWVTDGDGGSVWIHGDVPHPAGVWWPTLIPVGLVAALFGFIGFTTAMSGRSADVHLYNGLDYAVVVSDGDDSWMVSGYSYKTIELDTATDVEVTASFEDDALPFETVLLPMADSGSSFGDSRDVVYNIGGRGLLVVDSIVYGDGEPLDTILAPGRISVIDAVDYAFREPPEEMRTRTNSTYKSWLHAVEEDLARSQAMQGLVGLGYAEEALEMGTTELMLGNNEMAVMGLVASLRFPDGLPDAGFCDELMQHSDHLNRHRFCQQIDFRQDPEATIARYRELAQKNAGSAKHQYLLGRILKGSEALAAQGRALAIDPKYARAHYAVAWHHAVTHGDAKLALEHLLQAAEVDPQIEGLTDLEARLRQRSGEPATAIAEALRGRTPDFYSLADMYALKGDPERYQPDLVRVSRSEYSDADIANTHANIALVAGKLDDLRKFNTGGGGLELFVALSDGATDADIATELPEPVFMSTRILLYYWLAERQQGGDGAGWVPFIEEEAPGLAALLTSSELSEEALLELLYDTQPSTHVGAFFAAYRISGDERYAELARGFALPSELPVFANR